MVLLAVAAARDIHNVPDLLNNLGVPDPLWDAFTATAGDPGNDVRLLAAMPVCGRSRKLWGRPCWPRGNV